VIEVRGQLYVEAPKNRKWRQAVYPSLTPAGWPLAEMVAARIAAVGAEQDAGTNPLGLMFPAPAGGYWRPLAAGDVWRGQLDGGRVHVLAPYDGHSCAAGVIAPW
jgi:hypothetical protein